MKTQKTKTLKNVADLKSTLQTKELLMFSIRDTKAGVFHRPFYKNNQAEAERDFATGANDKKSTMFLYPEDFDLYLVGSYDENTGTGTFLETPQHIQKAIHCTRPDHPMRHVEQ